MYFGLSISEKERQYILGYMVEHRLNALSKKLIVSLLVSYRDVNVNITSID